MYLRTLAIGIHPVHIRSTAICIMKLFNAHYIDEIIHTKCTGNVVTKALKKVSNKIVNCALKIGLTGVKPGKQERKNQHHNCFHAA